MRRRAIGAAVLLALAAAAGGCGGEEARGVRGPHRFAEELPVRGPQGGYESIAQVAMRTLAPPRPVYRFQVVDPPPRPRLVFSAGVSEGDGPAAVRFEVVLESAGGARETVWAREATEPGWTRGSVDLAGRQLSGATLIFRAMQTGGVRGLRARWGNPMLVAGEPQPAPSLLLVSIDTLRADFVGCYGREAARTPVLDRLAAEGTRWEHAYSPSTWTLPSHAALLFGRQLTAAADGAPPAELGFGWGGPERPLAALLARAGYRTAAFTGGGFVDWRFGFARGFDSYFSFAQPRGARCGPDRFDGPTVFARAREWLRHEAAEPFFLFVHTYDVHDRCPFIPPKQPWYRGWPPQTPRVRLTAYYDDLIAQTDARLGALLAVLEERGLAGRTLVVVTSDHGEAYGEHGARGHGCDMRAYDELARVPLLVRFPGHVPAGGRVAAPVSLTALAPALLRALGVPAAPWMEPGVLPGLDRSGEAPVAAPLFVHCGDALAVRAGRYKLLTSRGGRWRDELYDLVADAGERAPLADDAVAAPLHAAARAFTASLAAGAGADAAAAPQDPALRERLRALGYVE